MRLKRELQNALLWLPWHDAMQEPSEVWRDAMRLGRCSRLKFHIEPLREKLYRSVHFPPSLRVDV